MTPATHSLRIVVLDGYTANPGDLTWQALAELGQLTVHDHTAPAEVLSRAQGAQVLLTNKTPLPAVLLRQLPELQYIGVLATGYNVVDIAAARSQGVTVTNVPGYSTASVAQLVFALLLELTHHIGHHSEAVRNGRWSKSRDFCFCDYPLQELAGQTLGIIGLGAIGEAVARIGLAFDMKVLACTRTPKPMREQVDFTTLEDLLSRADVVSLHCPLTPQTTGLINTQRLALMKPTAFLINTGRGPLIVETDLALALEQARLAGAGLDVLSSEPPAPDNPLLQARNCLITPHLGWATRAARKRLLDCAAENLRRYLTGTPCHVVNHAT